MISIHALVKRATLCRHCTSYLQNISIHALAKRATEWQDAGKNVLIISIHALAKRATYTYQSHGKFLKSFQSTPSQRGRPSPLPANWDWCMNFNPRPRKEGDSFCTLYKISRFISIHALVKRATLNNFRYFQIKTISIHALVKRATFDGFAD